MLCINITELAEELSKLPVDEQGNIEGWTNTIVDWLEEKYGLETELSLLVWKEK